MSLSAELANEAQIKAVREDAARQLEAAGVPAERIPGMLSFGALASAISEGSVADVDFSAYAPDPANDRAETLRRQLEEGKANLLIVQPLTDGRVEQISLDVAESRAYYAAPLAEREMLRLRKTRERHIGTALAAANRLRESGASASSLSFDEQMCLREYGALTDRRHRVAREGGGYRYERGPVIHDRAIENLTRAVREGVGAPQRVREWYPYSEVDSVIPPSRRGFYAGYLDVWGEGIEYAAMQWGNQIRELSISQVWDEQAKARAAYATDPMVKFALQVKVAYILGRGMRVEADDEAVQAAVDDFTERHNARTFRRWVLSTHLMGEIFLRRLRQPGGKIRFAKLPAPTIWETVTDMEDATLPLYYVQRYTTRFQQFAPPGASVTYIERILPAEDIIHFKINDDEDETRGRSEVYASLPWHRRIKDVADAMVEHEYVMNAYTHYAKIQGTQGDVNAFLASMPKGRPRPNTYLAFNEKVQEFGMVAGTTTSGVQRGSVMEMLQVIAAWGYGLPKEYFGISGSSTRGGAVIAEGPIQKLLEERQEDIVDDFAVPIYRAVITEAKARGPLAAAAEEQFTAILPEIIKADSATRIKNLQVGRAEGWVSSRTAGNLYGGEMDMTDYDWDDEQTEIEEEATKFGIGLPAMPGQTSEPFGGGSAAGGGNRVSGASADPTSAPDPGSSAGGAQIRKDDRNANKEAAIAEAACVLADAGAIVILD